MNCSLFIFKLEFAFLSPFFWSFELQKRAFRVTSVDTKSLCVVDLQAVDPDIYVQSLVDRGEILDLLINDEPWIEQKLSSFVYGPNPD